ncbi:MAG: ABC transporter ATP-binding protein [Candidatus Palauibacterales bacterium]|nr:ABC transporter ATP-binding protein [Candidatus Palauibacterales bacterium]MDP2528975.1 ABC transporter ATP-binding protein [Candidatus Palauibacterales bacterium]MDP2583793.1 ABC transporter ATP-binding protein [Candidatus Palauibacterales bacterium]
MNGEAVFEVEGLGFRYGGASREAVSGVGFRVHPGELFGILGPNGSGKSTLLRLLLGILPPRSGAVRVLGRPLASWSRRELARRVGVVPQHEEVAFPLSVREMVAMGRYPHLGPWRSETSEDREAIGRALGRCDLEDVAGRPLSTLSGGELQLARLARALAQVPELLVLDEPTASLDLRHGMEIFGLLRDLAGPDGTTVVLVTHDLNAASRFADRLLLLERGRPAACGRPHQVLVRETVERVYGWPVRVTRHPGPGPDEGAPQVVPLAPATQAADPSARGRQP